MAWGSLLAAVITASVPRLARAATSLRISISPSRSSAPPMRISRPFGCALELTARAASSRLILRVGPRMPSVERDSCPRLRLVAMECNPSAVVLQEPLPDSDDAVTHQHLSARHHVPQLERVASQ